MAGEGKATIDCCTEICIDEVTGGVFIIFNAWRWSLAMFFAFARTRDWKSSLETCVTGLERVGSSACRKRFSKS